MSRLPLTPRFFKVGTVYLVNGKRGIFMRSTKKGFNFYVEDEFRLFFKNHLYGNKTSRGKIQIDAPTTWNTIIKEINEQQ